MVKRGRLGGVSEMSLLPLRGWSVGGKYVCIHKHYPLIPKRVLTKLTN
jgi:hypothetical protein